MNPVFWIGSISELMDVSRWGVGVDRYIDG